jgi:molecular chaperone DnaK
VYNKVKEFFGKEPHKGVNPDEVVALGAAVQAGVLSGDVTDILLLDVTPLSLGIETLGGVMTVLILRNTTIPTKKSETFSTAADSQPSVTVHVLQGERQMAGDNKTLGKFNLDGLPPAPRGVPQIEVTFDIDANGIVHVSAKDKATGKEQKVRIESSSGLSDSEIDRLVQDAERNREADEKKREQIEARNKAEALAHSAEKTLKEFGDKVPASEGAAIHGKIEQLKQAIEANDHDKIASLSAEVEQSLHKLSEQLYSQAGGAGGPQAGGPGAGPQAGSGKGADDDVIDAEFEER